LKEEDWVEESGKENEGKDPVEAFMLKSGIAEKSCGYWDMFLS
jgi:hypothetical protein